MFVVGCRPLAREAKNPVGHLCGRACDLSLFGTPWSSGTATTF